MRAILEWAQIWPANLSIGDLPHYKILWQYEACAATGNNFSFLALDATWGRVQPWISIKFDQ